MSETFTRADLEELRDRLYKFSESRVGALLIGLVDADDPLSYAKGTTTAFGVAAKQVDELLDSTDDDKSLDGIDLGSIGFGGPVPGPGENAGGSNEGSDRDCCDDLESKDSGADGQPDVFAELMKSLKKRL